MRTKYLIGNWKMNMTRDETLKFIYDVTDELPEKDELKTVICPPFVSLRTVTKRQGKNLRVGAQNMHFEDNGAYTGEISHEMITSLAVEYAIIGHSERRSMYNDTDKTANKKIKTALKAGITPILCVGEDKESRNNKTYKEYVSAQIKRSLEGLKKSDVENIIIAYEPIWAVGTGLTATTEQAEEVCAVIREIVIEFFGYKDISILYGGSVKPSNIEELYKNENIDGFLIGGASLDSKKYLEMSKIMIKKSN